MAGENVIRPRGVTPALKNAVQQTTQGAQNRFLQAMQQEGAAKRSGREQAGKHFESAMDRGQAAQQFEETKQLKDKELQYTRLYQDKQAELQRQALSDQKKRTELATDVANADRLDKRKFEFARYMQERSDRMAARRGVRSTAKQLAAGEALNTGVQKLGREKVEEDKVTSLKYIKPISDMENIAARELSSKISIESMRIANDAAGTQNIGEIAQRTHSPGGWPIVIKEEPPSPNPYIAGMNALMSQDGRNGFTVWQFGQLNTEAFRKTLQEGKVTEEQLMVWEGFQRSSLLHIDDLKAKETGERIGAEKRSLQIRGNPTETEIAAAQRRGDTTIVGAPDKRGNIAFKRVEKYDYLGEETLVWKQLIEAEEAINKVNAKLFAMRGHTTEDDVIKTSSSNSKTVGVMVSRILGKFEGTDQNILFAELYDKHKGDMAKINAENDQWMVEENKAAREPPPHFDEEQRKWFYEHESIWGPQANILSDIFGISAEELEERKGEIFGIPKQGAGVPTPQPPKIPPIGAGLNIR